ncbi:MAG: hypothetical protein HRT52_02650 [Colwellia sp.]|nr:hypothetical protein [Colwellia sp.]
MEIQSAFNSGVQGFHKATEDATKAAADIASQTVVNDQQQQEFQSQESTLASDTAPVVVNEPTNLTQSLVELKVAEVQAKASAEVIQTADETLGSLVDVRV